MRGHFVVGFKSGEEGGENTFGAHGGNDVRGAPATHYFLPYEKIFRVPFVSIRGSIIPPFVYFVYFVVHSLLNVRTAEWPCGRAHARQPRTTFYLLLPTLYF